MNMRGAALHFLGDTFSSVAVIVAALIIWRTGWVWLDPALSILVALIIGYHAWNLTKDATRILMEGVPPGYEIKTVRQALMTRFPFLTDVHHIHLWAIAEDQVLISLHAKTDPAHIHDVTLVRLKQYLLHEHAIHHATIQLESSHPVCVEELTDVSTER